MKAAPLIFALSITAAAAACSDPGTGSAPATGGSQGTGGKSGTGGANGTGGASAGTGGASATGGKNGTGGAPGTGGGTAAGGTAGAGAGGTGAAGASGGKTAIDAGPGGTNGGTSGGTAKGGAVGGAAGGGSGTSIGGTTGTGGSTGSTVVGATPPMGWNSWNQFGCDGLNESVVKGVADTFVSSGMKDAGYQYVNLDDCWMSSRDSSGALQWDTGKFPGGMSALGEYIHGKGLKFGIYESPAGKTCAGRVGGAGHEQQDAQTFAKWGVDYLKYDHCGTSDMGSFARMGDALKATGRPIFYSINPVYGAGSCIAPPKCSINCPQIANMWRIEFDINASWGSFTGLINTDASLAQYASPGHWNDPDMLEVGRGMSADEDRSHFGMWAILAAPLITGNDIGKMSATTKAILTNKDVIAVDQDPLGKQGTRVATSGSSLEVWSKEMSGTPTTRAVALFNRSSAAASMSVTWSQIGMPAGAATVRDLYGQKDLGSFTDSYKADSVPSHGIVMLKIVSAAH